MRYTAQGARRRYLRRVVRLRLRALLAEKGITAYKLAKATGLNLSTVYRLTRPSGRFDRIAADTLDKLCRGLNVEPGELFERR